MASDKAQLLATAKAIAQELKLRRTGTPLRIRIPTSASETNTDGWMAVIGHIGKGGPRLEIWFDRVTGYRARKLYACFRSEKRLPITRLIKYVTRKLWPVRVVTTKDVTKEEYWVFVDRLKKSEFNEPILEEYSDGRTFYGIYDPTRPTSERLHPYFRVRAIAFFEDVARALPTAAGGDEHREVYPRYENRQRVASHLRRERSQLLATERKIRDKYKCQICGFDFERRYGSLGECFAEAHHIKPLSQLRERTQTKIEDLTTVCANCHRMLHRMQGERGDVKKLQAIMQKTRRKRK